MDKNSLVRFMNPNKLELIVLPTENCNFRCSYCYEDFSIGQMSDEVVRSLKAFVSKRIPSLKQFSISWFGGEPLMARSVVLDLMNFAKSICEEHGVSLKAGMTTNAYGLDIDTFTSLVNLGVRRYQISLDGDEEEHNKTRKLISGRGTFERIWRNLVAMQESSLDFKILLRMHVHQENIDSLKMLIPKLSEKFANDTRFQFMIMAVGNWGGDRVKQMSLLKTKAEVIDELNLVAHNHGWPEERISREEKEAFSPCYAATPNSFVVRADGSLAKCTVALGDPRNSIGKLNQDGSVEISNEKMRAFMHGFQTLDEAALSCPMRAMPKSTVTQVIKVEKKLCGDKYAEATK